MAKVNKGSLLPPPPWGQEPRPLPCYQELKGRGVEGKGSKAVSPVVNKNKDCEGNSVKTSFWSSDVWVLFPVTTQRGRKLLGQKKVWYPLLFLSVLPG